MNGGEEVAGGFVVARGDGAELFEPAEEVLDEMAGLVEVLVVVSLRSPITFGGDDRRFAGPSKWLDHPLAGIETLVGDQRIGREVGKKRVGAVEVMGLARGEVEAGGIAERIDGGVDLGAQSSPASPDGLRAVFLSAPALC